MSNILETAENLAGSPEAPVDVANQLCAHLSDHPEDIPAVVKLMRVLASGLNLNDKRFSQHLRDRQEWAAVSEVAAALEES